MMRPTLSTVTRASCVSVHWDCEGTPVIARLGVEGCYCAVVCPGLRTRMAAAADRRPRSASGSGRTCVRVRTANRVIGPSQKLQSTRAVPSGADGLAEYAAMLEARCLAPVPGSRIQSFVLRCSSRDVEFQSPHNSLSLPKLIIL